LRFSNRLLQLAGVLCVSLIFAVGTSATTTTSTATKPKPKHPQTFKTHTSSTSKHHSKPTVKSVSHSRGQRGIDEERTRAIQTALIQQHYLTGEPSGVWDQASKDAMTKYQADNGWQTKLTPDSRALIKLGLGPDHKGLLNPETANIPSPHDLGVDSEAQPGGATEQQ
jgi:hypothetical protein